MKYYTNLYRIYLNINKKNIKGWVNIVITKEMTIGEIIKANSNKADVLMKFGMGCVGCPSAKAETIEEAANVHGINLNELLEALNR